MKAGVMPKTNRSDREPLWSQFTC